MPELDRPTPSKLTVLLDTGPLISLCAYKIKEKPLIEIFLEYAIVYIAASVSREALLQPSYADVHIAKPLIESQRILTLAPPKTPIILDTYTKLGYGERDIIRIGISKPESTIIIDDHFAFIVASRFDLRPMLLLDALISLFESYRLPKKVAFEMVQSLSLRYSTPFVKHTLQKLEELE